MMENEDKLSHDEYQELVVSELMKKPDFKNFYQTRIVRDFPKPDIIMIERTKNPEKIIAFEFKPPYSDKREYLTGLGQAISYFDAYPYSYLIIPDQTIDGINIPEFINRLIEKTKLSLGLIKYDISNYDSSIVKFCHENININKSQLQEEIIKNATPWSFWMDTSITEVAKILKLIGRLKNDGKIPSTDKSFVMAEIWDNILTERYTTTSPGTINSFKLNYQLFFDHLNLWTKNFEPTNIGNRLREIAISYGNDSREFNNALSYLLLTDGNYLLFYRYIHEFQALESFNYRGNDTKLLAEIRKMRVNKGLHRNSYEKDDELVEEFEKNGDEWLRIVTSQFYKRGFGAGLTQILSDISHKMPYMDSKLESEFLLGYYQTGKGYPINWIRITRLIKKGKENLNVI